MHSTRRKRTPSTNIANIFYTYSAPTANVGIAPTHAPQTYMQSHVGRNNVAKVWYSSLIQMNPDDQNHVVEFIDGLSTMRLQPNIVQGSLRHKAYDKMLGTVVRGLLDEEVFPERPTGSLQKLAYDNILYEIQKDRDENEAGSFVHWLSGAQVLLERTAGSLRTLAWNQTLSEMKKIGDRYDFMRCVDTSKPKLLVISDFDVFILTQRPTSQMFTDFPHYHNNMQLPVNVASDGYYRIDRIENGDAQQQRQYVAAGIGPPGILTGKKLQAINFISPDGAASSGPHLIHFAIPFGD